jgi:fructose-bisphosphate aldolase class II
VLCISFFEEEGEDMPLVTSREMLLAAYSRQYAIGAFNAHNLETVAAIVEAAEEERAPVIIQLSRSSIEYAGLEAASNLVKTAAQRASVPVVLHLDHGMDVSLNVRCLRAGFTSLMCDGTELFLQRYKQESGDGTLSFDMIVDKVQSREAYEENLRQTRKVVGLAHACGVPVEAELGKIPRIGDFQSAGISMEYGSGFPEEAQELTRRLFAIPEMAEEFVRESGCDSLAVACGSIHGMEEAVQPLNIAHLERLASCTNIPLVLHGSSGVVRTRKQAMEYGLSLSREEGSIEDAIRAGVAKVNISTDLQVVFMKVLKEVLEENPEVVDMRKLLPPVIEAVKERVAWFIRLFGSSGKA